jgi:hypothetical protein
MFSRWATFGPGLLLFLEAGYTQTGSIADRKSLRDDERMTQMRRFLDNESRETGMCMCSMERFRSGVST